MQQQAWWRASVLGTLAASLAFGCSSGDAAGGAQSPGSAGSSAAAAGANSAGTSASSGASSQAGAATAGSGQSGGTGSGGGSNGGNAQSGASSTGGSSSGGASNGGTSGNAGSSAAGSSGAGNNSGAPTAEQLLAKLGACNKIRGPFNPDGPNTGNIDVCKTGDVVWWKADMDVDCDGIQTPPCNTDNTGQPMTSIVDLAPNGDVDPTLLPYFVIPLGTPETEWYTPYGIDLGQVGAVIYKNKVIYGVFADQAGGNFIGEASYKMCSLFIGANNCDPNMGGIDPLDVTYVTFTGTAARATGKDIYDHDKHTSMGEAAAQAWLAK